MSRRLPPRDGEWIDRTRPFSFEFEGHRVAAFEGDVITSALLAAGRRTLARSFKYHRPRSVLSFANHDANVLVENDQATNIRADVTAPERNARYRAVNTIGGLRFDRGRLLEVLAPLLPAGFYYKAFHRPRILFPTFERIIRNLAGLGRLPRAASRERMPLQRRSCDVLVIGAGPAGLSAAAEIARSGAEVWLVDEQARLGGSLNHLRADDVAGHRQAEAHIDSLENAGVRIFTRTFAAACYTDGEVPLVGPNGVTLCRPRQVVLAAGCFEQPAVFAENDRPGVMLAGAALRLSNCYAVSPFHRGVLIAGHAEAYRTLDTLRRTGLDVDTVVDIGSGAPQAIESARAAGITVIDRVTGLAGVSGGGELDALAVHVEQGPRITVDCDGALMATGYAAAGNLAVQAGGRMVYDPELGRARPDALPPHMVAAGSLNGAIETEACSADGERAAEAVLAALAGERLLVPAPASTGAEHIANPVIEYPEGKAFVDFDEDLTPQDLRLAVREGFDSLELAKRYTTIGMGPSQGKHSNANGARIIAAATGRDLRALGATTPRPFYHPVPMGAVAGRRLRPLKRTPLHDLHTAAGARWFESGPWLRPRCYGGSGAINNEYRAVRGGAGIIDVSTLGKIELFGPDALALLDYSYPCAFGRLVDGMSRYVFMTDGGGTLIDDGICARLAADHFYLTTTTSQARTVLRQLDLNAVQLGLDVVIVDRTATVAAVNLAGPQCRRHLAPLTDIDLTPDAFPYQALREGRVCGVPARLVRVGFTGELGYEIHVASNDVAQVWQALVAAGAKPFGVDTQRLLRLEKGHLLIGQDTDGTTNPYEVGLGRAVSRTKPRFVGRHALLVHGESPRRRTLAFVARGPLADAIVENHLVIDDQRIAGRVTSVAWSPARGEVIGLALVEDLVREVGETLVVRGGAGEIPVTVVDLPFYDAGNERQAAPWAAGVSPPGTAGIAAGDQPAQRAASPPGAVPAGSWTNALADLGATPARLVCGEDAIPWLRGQGIPVPEQEQGWWDARDGALVMRIHPGQVLVVESARGESLRLEAGRAAERTLVFDHCVAAFGLRGPWVEDVFAELCAAPRSGTSDRWRSLRFARLDVILGMSPTPGGWLRVFCEPAEATYLHDVLRHCLDDARGEVLPAATWWAAAGA